MTQLFDTTTYEDLEGEEAVATTESLAHGGRHLRSIPAGDDMDDRKTQWRLDDRTIEVGRKGILAARQALQDAARDATTTEDKPARKAA